VSLRKEVHSAIDGIAPSTFGMPERVVQTVLHDAKRRRKGKLMLRVRAPLSLVAVLLLIALVAAVLVSGRVVHDWNLFHREVPAGPGHAALATLEARPILLPKLTPSDSCPDGPVTAGVYGNGPYYGDPSLGPPTPRHTAWGRYWDLVGLTDRSVSGLLLVRAVDVKTHQPYVFVGQYAAGPIVGTDGLSGQTVQQRSELVLDTAHQPRSTSNGKTRWPFTVGVPNGNSGCYGWQIDGDSFTETFVFDAGPT
jgi:hypothetical protein